MKKILFIFCLFVTISVFSQEERRLALVIGNANYEKGTLDNPVNDANLIAKTLDSLNFEVILATNIEDKRSLENKIREFGAKRSDFDVGFVYYAGHGVQINGENYLLPTKEFFESEEDIEYNAVAVSKIMKYLKSTSDQVNILVLDACRDNPFETNWNATRSLKGQGLAKIPPPTGSLIAFSTDAGNTAADGEGINSIYTLSLTKNMLLEDTSIDQVFRNVRGEVLGKTDGKQRPIEATQLTGQTYYLNPGNFEKEFKEVENNLVNKIELKETIDVLKIIIEKDSSNSKAFLYKGHTNVLLKNPDSAIEDYNRAIKLDSLNLSAYYSLVFHKDGEFSYTGIANVFHENRRKSSAANTVLDDLYKLNKNNPFYYRLKSYISNDENEKNSLIDYSLNKISDEDIIYFYNEQTLSFNNRFNPVIDFKTIQTLRKMELFINNNKYQDAINLKENFISENSNVLNNDKFLKEKTIGMLATATLASFLFSNQLEKLEKHARDIKNSSMLEFKLVGSLFLQRGLILKGEFKEILESLTYDYELQKNSKDIKRAVLNRFYYGTFLELLNTNLLVYENDIKALELLNEFIIDLDKDRFNIWIEEKQTMYYYRYIVNLLLDRKEDAKNDLDLAINMNVEVEFAKKTYNILNPYANNEGELYADQLYEPKENMHIQEMFTYNKINYYYLMRNNLDYQNYLKLFNANMQNTSKKEFNILNSFIINSLKYNSNNSKTLYY